MPKQKVTSLGQSHRPGQYAETKGYPWAKPPSRAVCRNKRLPTLGKATVQGSMPKQKVTYPVQRFKCDVTAALTWHGARVARYAFSVRLFHSRLHARLSRRYPAQKRWPHLAACNG